MRFSRFPRFPMSLQVFCRNCVKTKMRMVLWIHCGSNGTRLSIQSQIVINDKPRRHTETWQTQVPHRNPAIKVSTEIQKMFVGVSFCLCVCFCLSVCSPGPPKGNCPWIALGLHLDGPWGPGGHPGAIAPGLPLGGPWMAP